MTYSKDKVVGLSVPDAIGLICAGTIDANHWATFRGCIELSEGQIVSVGGDYMQGPGILIIGGAQPKKTRDQINSELYAAALLPMFRDLAAGELVVECRAIAAGAGGPLFTFAADAWEDAWKLIIESNSATLVDEGGAKYKLRTIRLASAEPAAAAAVATISASEKRKKKPGRKDIDDSKPLARLVELLASGQFKSISKAVHALLADGSVKVEGASERAIYERLRGKLDESYVVHENAPDGVTLTARVLA